MVWQWCGVVFGTAMEWYGSDNDRDSDNDSDSDSNGNSDGDSDPCGNTINIINIIQYHHNPLTWLGSV